MKKPLIGITANESKNINPPHSAIFALNQVYISAIEESGGVPLMLPPILSEESMREVFARLDGIVFSGGGDINPTIYDEPPHSSLWGLSDDRDRVELEMARWAAHHEKPLLGICRGTQVLNVALGGTLIQDIPSEVPDALEHSFDDTRVPRDYIAHPVKIADGSHLRDVLQADIAAVNSWHHQALKRIAPDLKVVAQSPDGVVEAVEIEGHRFAIGVQWHPEWLYANHPEMKRLFTALVEASSNGHS
jgi:putative glutamine amidotransferase